MEVSLAICILAALLATGTCLQCEVCTESGNNCTGSMQTCAAGEDSCGIFLTEVIGEGKKAQSIHKDCVTSSQWKAGPWSMNFGNGMTIRMSITCCVGDTCKTVNVTLPPANTTLNGLHCPACFGVFADQCSEKTVQCTGDETQCIDIVGTLTTGGNTTKIIIKGCVTESVCTLINAGYGTFLGIRGDLPKYTCTPATRAAGTALGPAGLLLPALTGLLLLKFLS